MKKLYKAALLAALGLGSISAAQASTDLLLGFNDSAGPALAQNDYVIDLGLNGATLLADANANGGTYNLSSLFNATTFSTAFGADANNLNNVCAGVVGGYSISPELLYQTVAMGVTPPVISPSAFNNAAAAPQGVVIGEYGSGNTSGWSAYVSVNATTAGSDIAGNSVYNNTGISPVGNLSAGVLSMELWGNSSTGGLHPVLSGWVDQGTFNINATAGTVTFTVAPVPEPSSIALMGLAGLAALPLLRRFNRNNA